MTRSKTRLGKLLGTKAGRRASTRRLRLESLEDRHLLSGLGLQFPIEPLTTGGPSPAVESQAISGEAAAAVAPASEAPQAYVAPDEVQAWVDGTTVHYRVKIGNTWHPGKKTYDATQSIVELVNSNGVVAWSVARKSDALHQVPRLVGFAVYDKDDEGIGRWVQDESPNVGVLAITDLQSNDGVVSWSVGYHDSETDTYIPREVGAAVYDQELREWRQFQTYTSGGVRNVGEVINENGIVGWTVGVPDGSGGYSQKSAVMATYDYTLHQWQRYQVNAGTGQTVWGLAVTQDAVTWQVGSSTAAGGMADDVGAGLYDTALGKWRTFSSRTGDDTTVEDVVVDAGTIAWTTTTTNTSGDTQEGVGFAQYDTVQGGWMHSSVTYAPGTTVGELTNDSNVVAWKLHDSGGAASDVGYATYNPAAQFNSRDQRWEVERAQNTLSMSIGELYNADGVVTWTYVQDGTTPRAVGASVFDPGQAQWKQFQSANDSVSKVDDLQTADGLIAWQIAHPTAGGDYASRDVAVIAYDYGQGEWQVCQTDNPPATQVQQLVVADGVAAWSTMNSVHMAVYDRLRDDWGSKDLTADDMGYSEPVRINEIITESGLVAWSVARPTDDAHDEFRPNEVGFAIYDVANHEWKDGPSDPPADAREVDSLSIENVAVQYSIDGDTHKRSYDAKAHTWSSDQADEATPLPVFVAEPTAVTTKTGVRFSDMSMGATHWEWDFGDGLFSTMRSVSHAYSQVGMYTVTLQVDGPGGTDTSSMTVAVVPASTDAPTDLGTVGSQILADQSPEDGILWYELQPAADGAFTVDIDGDGITANTAVAFLTKDATGQYSLLGSGTTHAEADSVTAGTTYYVAVTGLDDVVNVQLGNPATLPLAAPQQTIFGTEGDDVIEIARGSAFTVTVNGETVTLDPAVTQLDVFTFGGEDTVTIQATSGDEWVKLSPSGGTVSGAGYGIEVTGSETLIVDGGGGADVLELFDSAGNDVYTARPGEAELVGDGFHLAGKNFRYAHAYATAGGVDVAHLFDSAGKDQLVGNPDWVRISGSSYLARAKLFDYVHGYSTAGGPDTATLTDSAGDDRFTATPEYSRLQGEEFNVRVKFFARVTAMAHSGDDTAWFYDSHGSDEFQAGPDWAQMQGTGFDNSALGFSSVTAVSQYGDDVAQLFDSPGDDVYTAGPYTTELAGPGYSLQTRGFTYGHAYATAGGVDVAHLYDSAGDDRYVATPEYGRMSGTGYSVRAKLFDYVHGYSTAGGNDAALLFDSAGDDVFAGSPKYGILRGTGFYNRAKGFADMSAYAKAGGTDSAVLSDSPGADLLEAGSNWARISDNYGAVEFLFSVYDFDQVQARSSDGSDTKSLDPASASFLTATGW